MTEAESGGGGPTTPPGSGSRAPTALYSGAGRPLGGSGPGPGDDDPKWRGGWKLRARCGCATMRRCGSCRTTVCQRCEEGHLRSDCVASTGLCAVCGPQPTISACTTCDTRFCPDHQRHDCPTPTGDGGAARRSPSLRYPLCDVSHAGEFCFGRRLVGGRRFPTW